MRLLPSVPILFPVPPGGGRRMTCSFDEDVSCFPCVYFCTSVVIQTLSIFPLACTLEYGFDSPPSLPIMTEYLSHTFCSRNFLWWRTNLLFLPFAFQTLAFSFQLDASSAGELRYHGAFPNVTKCKCQDLVYDPLFGLSNWPYWEDTWTK